jgi:hypothetical protein
MRNVSIDGSCVGLLFAKRGALVFEQEWGRKVRKGRRT